MTFGEKIKNLRKSKHMNQTQLANAIGVSLRTIRGWEIEGRYPKQHDLYQKLADTLGCDVSYLMNRGRVFHYRSLGTIWFKRRKTGSADHRTGSGHVRRRRIE